MPEPIHQNITELLRELMKERRVSADKLADVTDIPKRFITSLMEGDASGLPAQPYVRGYLFRIAEALKVDPHILWQSYRMTSEFQSSGEHDRLPSNRFAFKKIRTSRIIAFLSIVLVLAFVGLRYDYILGRPTIDLDIPESTSEETITINGSVSPGDNLTLNREVIYPNKEGVFETRVQLEPGSNLLRFRVKRYLGQEAVFDEQIFYQPKIQSIVKRLFLGRPTKDFRRARSERRTHKSPAE